MRRFDAIVVGTGSSGTAAALRCAKAGLQTAIVDELPYGGTCVLRGCDPKKVLVGAGELIDWAERMTGYGIAGEIRIDWEDLMRFKHTFTDPQPTQREKLLRDAGVTTLHGVARFTGRNSIAIDGEAMEFEHAIIAAGARPATLHLPGEELLATSTDFLDLEHLPKRIAFIGGGYIAFEFAHLVARAASARPPMSSRARSVIPSGVEGNVIPSGVEGRGTATTILQRGPRVLVGFEPSLVDKIVEVSAEVGIDVRVNVEVDAVEHVGSAFRVTGKRDGEAFALECDLVVHAAGRVPDLDALDLAAAGVETGRKGATVNEYLQSRSNPAVYAVGDCADGGGLPLTPTASLEGDVAASNVVDGNKHVADFTGLATICYTVPSLGSVGLTSDAAQQRGLKVRVSEGDSTQWYSSRRIRARCSAYCILVDGASGEIVGAHVLSPHTEELINVFSLAMRAKVNVDTLKAALFGYPTAASDMDDLLA